MYISHIVRKLIVANKFRRSFKVKHQLESVIRDLEKDTLIEIASGVAQANSGMEQIIAKFAQHTIGNATSYLTNFH